MKKLLLPLIALAFVFSACQKPVWQYSETLERHQWQMISYSENGVFLTVPACEAQQTYSFYNTETGIVVAGTARCDTFSTTDTLVHFGWSVDGDQEHLFLEHFGNFDYNPIWFFVSKTETRFEVTGVDQRNDSAINYDKIFVAIN